MDKTLNRIGWNSSFYNDDQSVIYSGDMTSANPEATELMYAKNGIPDSVVKVNMYHGKENSKFTLFLAQVEPGYKVKENQMVDPNDIVFSTQMEAKSAETLCGIFIKNKFQFANIRTGNGRVSNGDSVTSQYIKFVEETTGTYLNLEMVLETAGFKVVYDGDADIDLSVLDKSSLIEFLS